MEASPAIAAPTYYETGFRKFIITVTVILCSVVELIDTSVVNVAITDLMGNLGATLGEVSWVIASYAIANVIVVPLSGWFGTQFGRKNYYMASLGIFVISSMLCGLSTNIWVLVFWRFIQGLGGGALLATSQTILFETYRPEERGMATAFFGIGVILGPSLGPTVGGYIIDNISWPWIFYVNLPIGIVALTNTFLFIHDRPGSRKPVPLNSVDWWGLFFLVLGIGSLQLVLEQGEREDWFESSYIVFATLLALAGIAAFVWRELTTPNPIVDLRVLRHLSLGFGTVLLFVLGFVLYASVLVFPVLTQRGLGFTATDTGLVLLPAALAGGMLMPIMGRLIQKGFPVKILVSIGFTLIFLSSMWMYFTITPSSGELDFYLPQIVRGFGLGFLFIPLTNLALAGLQGKELAQGAGLTNMMRQLGGSFGVAIVSTYITTRTGMRRADLTNFINDYSSFFQERLTQVQQAMLARGMDPTMALKRAYALVDFGINRQALLLAYTDAYTLVGLFCLAAIPMILLIRLPKNSAPVDTSAAH
jgi:DHA2 family multidrug resistance protein